MLCELYLNFFKKLMKSYFLFGLFFRNSQGGAPRGMLDLIASLISREEKPQTCGVPSILPSPHEHHCQPWHLEGQSHIHRIPTTARIPVLPPRRIPKSHTPSRLHFLHCTCHLLVLSLQNLVLLIDLSRLHKTVRG